MSSDAFLLAGIAVGDAAAFRPDDVDPGVTPCTTYSS